LENKSLQAANKTAELMGINKIGSETGYDFVQQQHSVVISGRCGGGTNIIFFEVSCKYVGT